MDGPHGPDKTEAIGRLIHVWAKGNATKIQSIWDLGWGWEAWLQADQAYYLHRVTGMRLGREMCIYKEDDSRRMDLTIWDDSGSLLHYFEFKCKPQRAGTTTFFNGLNDDLDKVQKALRVRAPRARAWVMGVFVNRDTEPLENYSNWDACKVDNVWVLLRTKYNKAPKL
ncbi:hypothetical protein S7711_11560 [Stachybotrys chartarum IBT 7711]|uniref:Fungal-type protein kinase domain-containing protein n=1 Tax=Stachybotrys chartarum (strain CBS 109288 / IBT 7711) TaxID=1280523 RepID=A0A084AXM2_STACB|nr:hypothetical protein S7711_11560 [Stachybotrys chartarum IBT 7711]